jgi:hypothetical protein
MLHCKKCHNQIFDSNAEKEHGDIIIQCSFCGAKNILAPVIINKVALYSFLQVVGWRD